jgi:enamine deaminase RidA (YjgF/YER057c/UK114 family)
MPVEPLLPVEIAQGKILYAQGMKAGRWVFATGHLATDFQRGLAPAVLNARLPRYGRPKHEREAQLIFDRLQKILIAGGSNLASVVRLDQYYPTWKAVDPYHVVRRATFGDYIPPSTSVLQKGLLLPEADIEVQMLAIVPDSGLTVTPLRPSDVTVPPTSGFTPVVTAGDYVFVAGQMATDARGIAEDARPSAGQLWGGTQVKRETEYILRRRLEPALQAAKSSLAGVVKAQVYMSDVDDFPAFNQVWGRYFPKDPPVTTLVPTQGFGRQDGKIEINVLAVTDATRVRRQVIQTDVFTGYEHQSGAIKVGDLLLLSGLMAIDENGLVPDAEIDARQPHFGSSIQAQMERILDNASRICRAAGTALENVVRVQQFHTDLHDFYPAYQVWQRFLPGRPLPFSAVEVPSPMPVPGCTVLLDLWVHAP